VESDAMRAHVSPLSWLLWVIAIQTTTAFFGSKDFCSILLCALVSDCNSSLSQLDASIVLVRLEPLASAAQSVTTVAVGRRAPAW
jgi:ABC-type multidrug transport system permease subunit